MRSQPYPEWIFSLWCNSMGWCISAEYWEQDGDWSHIRAKLTIAIHSVVMKMTGPLWGWVKR